ncbi:MAG: zinc-ribbon domain-containing protein [Firmicutes bacterium]|nr:zinc-ribbon domain-containing protein [Bacillota bacterium]
MFCNHCGNPLKEGERFCTKCGKPVSVTPAVPPQNVKVNAKDDTKSSAAGKVILAVLGVIILGLIIAIGIVAGSRMKEAGREPVDQAEESSRKHSHEESADEESPEKDPQKTEDTAASAMEESSEVSSEETAQTEEMSELVESQTEESSESAAAQPEESSEPAEEESKDSAPVPEESEVPAAGLPDPFAVNIAYDILDVQIDGETLETSAGQGRAYEWLKSFFEGGTELTEEQRVFRTRGVEFQAWLINGMTYPAANAAGWGQPWLQAVAKIQSSPIIVNASASSELDESDLGLDHSAAMAFDGTLTNAWCEGVSGYGEGEWVKLELDSPCAISRMEIYAGYHKSNQLYYENSRPKEILVVFEEPDGNTTSETIVLEDKFEMQVCSFEMIHYAASVTIYIQSTYPGTTFDDTLITEVAFH